MSAVSLPIARPMTSFVSELAGTFAAEARRFLGVDEPGLVVTLERPKDGAIPWMVRADFRDGPQRGLVLELFDAQSTARAWTRAGAWALSYRRLPDGREPTQAPEFAVFLKGMKERLEKLPAAGHEAMRAALDAFLPWLGIDDEMFRQVSSGHAGLVATLRLGFRCNQDCSFCWQDREWPEPPAEYYFRWLDEMAERGVTSLSISGGEPTIHKELAGVIAHAKARKMNVSIQSNAIRLRKRDYLAKLVEAGLSGVFVSFHAPDAAVSDAMTRAPKTHQPTLDGIEACLAAGLDVRLNCVVERLNYELLPRHAQTIVERFIRPFPANPPKEVTYTFPSAYWDPQEWTKAIVAIDELRPYLINAVRVLLAEGIEVQATGTCGFPPCVLAGVDEALRFLPPASVSPMDASGRRYGAVCGECVMKDRCLGVRHEYQRVHGERGLVPFREEPRFVATVASSAFAKG
jgi:sulfatase maturation enzyme AslB (radical SAM superfamily)